MAITTLGAIALGVGALGGVASSAMNSSASRRAVDASTAATAENNALAREIYGENKQTLAPFVQQGGTATSYINSLLGIRPQQPMQQQGGGQFAFNPRDDFFSGYGGERGDVMGMGGFSPQNTQQMAGTVPTASPMDAQSGFDAFRNSTGYNFRLNEGNRAVNTGMAARGMGNSGAALKALQERGQNLASAEFGNYFNALAGQQSLGFNAASAQAGVAGNFSSQVQQNNAQNASNVGNAALARAGNNNAFLSSLIGAGAYVAGGRG